MWSKIGRKRSWIPPPHIPLLSSIIFYGLELDYGRYNDYNEGKGRGGACFSGFRLRSVLLKKYRTHRVLISFGKEETPMGLEIGIVMFFVYLILSVVFGCITNSMAVNKGYDGGFGWGFWLGIIGIIVVAVRPIMNANSASEQGVTTAATSVDDCAALEKLAKLHEQGILTDEEFQQKKANILSRM